MVQASRYNQNFQKGYENFVLGALSVYGVGCGLSQSLMSLGGTVLVVIFLYELLRWGRTLRSSESSFKLNKSDRWALVCLGFFPVLLGLRFIFLENPSNASRAWGMMPLYWVPLAGLFLLRLNFTRRDLAGPIVFTALAYALSVGYASLQFFVIGNREATSFFGNPIYLAYNFLPALAFFLYLPRLLTDYDKSRRKEASPHLRPWAVACEFLPFIVLIGIFLTVSRMAVFTALIFFVLFSLPRIVRFFGAKITFLCASVLVIPCTFWAARNKYILSKVVDVFNLSKSLSWQGRLAQWEHNWNLFLEHPFFGVGALQNAIRVKEGTAYADLWSPGFDIYSHSIYFQHLAESGIIGATLFFTGFIALAFSSRMAATIVGITLVGGLLENTFNNSKAAHPVFFFVLLAVLFERSRRVEKVGL